MSVLSDFATELKLVDKLVRRLDRAFIQQNFMSDADRQWQARQDAAALADAQEYLRIHTTANFRDRCREALSRAKKRKETM